MTGARLLSNSKVGSELVNRLVRADGAVDLLLVGGGEDGARERVSRRIRQATGRRLASKQTASAVRQASRTEAEASVLYPAPHVDKSVLELKNSKPYLIFS